MKFQKGEIASGVLITLAATTIFGLAGFFNHRTNSVAEDVSVLQTEFAQKAEVISSLNTSVPAIEKRLDKIEDKLDELIRILK